MIFSAHVFIAEVEVVAASDSVQDPVLRDTRDLRRRRDSHVNRKKQTSFWWIEDLCLGRRCLMSGY